MEICWFLASDEYSLGFLREEKGWQIVSRKKDLYHGDWMNNFNFYRKEKFLSGLDLPNPWDFSFSSLIPENLIIGIDPKDSKNILAGTFYGWIMLLGGYLLEISYGRGKLVITTLSFRDFLVSFNCLALEQNYTRVKLKIKVRPKAFYLGLTYGRKEDMLFPFILYQYNFHFFSI